MQGVVTPNMVAATRGFSSAVSGFRFPFIPTIPAMASTALRKMVLEILLSPATSTMEGIMMMSLVPTYWDTFPEAMVETMSFGTPMGRARMAGVARDVPPDPPRERIPSNLPSS